MIEINNTTATVVDESFLKEVAKKVLKGENKEKENLSIAFVGEGRMRKLNKKYRGKNRTTDVLSFGQSGEFPKGAEKRLGIGEVVICLRTVKKNARRYHLTFKKELAKVLIHGILHLLGYDHEKGKTDAEKMKEKEEHYFNL